ncbi:MAG: ankyrin repeat domain-containing protein [Saprospiraceae bacterium]|nr:ankyrin repeat domain-containing protein [Saprospiraceae bacterium]
MLTTAKRYEITSLKVLFICLLASMSLATIVPPPDWEDFIPADNLEAFQKVSLPAPDTAKCLKMCIEKGALRIAQHLIQTIENPNQLDKAGHGPMHYAVLHDQLLVVESLLSRSALVDLRTTTELQATPLMFACSRNHPEIFNLLIDHGADINAIDAKGDPVANWAAYYGNRAALSTLVGKGVDLSIQTKHGDAADVLLRLWHDPQELSVFGGSILERSISAKQKEIFHAISQKQASEVRRLLDQGIDPNTTDAYGSPLLHQAVFTADVDLLDVLLNYDIEVDAFNRVGQTALALAARWEHPQIVQRLLEAGADPNGAGERYQLTPLIGSVIGRNLEITNTLVEAGASIDLKDKINDAAALHWAYFYGNEAAVLALLEAGADYRMKIFANTNDLLSLAEKMEPSAIKEKINQYEKNRKMIAGSWTLSQIRYIYSDTTYVVDQPAGGLFMGSPERYMIMYHPTSEARPAFKDFSKPSCDELRAAFQHLVFNTGAYLLTDKRMTVTPDLARVPGFEGAKQVYQYEVQDEQLSLTLFDETYPNGKKPEWYGKLQIQLQFQRE